MQVPKVGIFGKQKIDYGALRVCELQKGAAGTNGTGITGMELCWKRELAQGSESKLQSQGRRQGKMGPITAIKKSSLEELGCTQQNV